MIPPLRVQLHELMTHRRNPTAAVTLPYRRTCRQFTDGHYAVGGKAQYIEHPKYAQSPEHFVRAFLLLLKDMQELFDYVEPADKNLPCYSYRIHEFLLRACVEVEANCKAILTENGYTKKGNMKKKGKKKGNMNMRDDYCKIDQSHRLSSYEVGMPFWHGTSGVRIRKPFSAWPSGSLPWYQAYNTTKHNRHQAFHEATFEQMIDAMGGLAILLSSQFFTYDFAPGPSHLLAEGTGVVDWRLLHDSIPELAIC